MFKQPPVIHVLSEMNPGHTITFPISVGVFYVTSVILISLSKLCNYVVPVLRATSASSAM
jgi:hypothetical protein